MAEVLDVNMKDVPSAVKAMVIVEPMVEANAVVSRAAPKVLSEEIFALL